MLGIDVNWIEISEWLKGTILGIIILGALGSVLAVVFIKVLAHFLNHYLKILLQKILEKYFKPALLQRLILRELKKKNAYSVVTHTVILSFVTLASFFIFISFVNLTVFYFFVRGASLTITSITLVVLSMLTGIYSLRKAVSLFVIYVEEIDAEVFKSVEKIKHLDFQEIRKHLDQKNV